jgi:multiple sugar transport system permease protein
MIRGGAAPAPRSGLPAVNYIVLTPVALVVLLPFIWMILTALKPQNEVMTNPPTWIPTRLALENFPRSMSFFPFDRFLVNTLIVALGATALQMLTACLAAYAFARLRFRGRNVLFLVYLGTLMIPQQVTVVPLFLMMRSLGWIDTFAALILPSAFHALGVFLLRQFFLTIPRELEEAAVMDGAGRVRILWQLMLPLSRPALATLALFTFIREWNSFLWPLIATNQTQMRTVAVGLSLFQGQYGTEWHLLMAASTITLLPALVLFLLTQRYFIEGVALTGFGGR